MCIASQVKYIVLVRPSALMSSMLVLLRPFTSIKAARKIRKVCSWESSNHWRISEGAISPTVCRSSAADEQVESLDELEEATGGEVKSSQLGSTFISEQRGGPQYAAPAATAPPPAPEVELAPSS